MDKHDFKEISLVEFGCQHQWCIAVDGASMLSVDVCASLDQHLHYLTARDLGNVIELWSGAQCLLSQISEMFYAFLEN